MNKTYITNPAEQAIADKYFGTSVGNIRLGTLSPTDWANFVAADETERQQVLAQIVAAEDSFPAHGFRNYLVRFAVALVVAFAAAYAPKFLLHLGFMQNNFLRIALETVLFAVAVLFVPKIAITKDPRTYGIHRRKALVVLYKIMLWTMIVGIIVSGFFAMKALLPLLDKSVSQQEKVVLRYDMYWYFSLGVAAFVGFLCTNGELAIDASSCKHCNRINCVALVAAPNGETVVGEEQSEQPIETNAKTTKHAPLKAKCFICGRTIGVIKKKEHK